MRKSHGLFVMTLLATIALALQVVQLDGVRVEKEVRQIGGTGDFQLLGAQHPAQLGLHVKVFGGLEHHGRLVEAKRLQAVGLLLDGPGELGPGDSGGQGVDRTLVAVEQTAAAGELAQPLVRLLAEE